MHYVDSVSNINGWEYTAQFPMMPSGGWCGDWYPVDAVSHVIGGGNDQPRGEPNWMVVRDAINALRIVNEGSTTDNIAEIIAILEKALKEEAGGAGCPDCGADDVKYCMCI